MTHEAPNESAAASVPISELDPLMRLINGFCHELDQTMIEEGIAASRRAKILIRGQARFIETLGKAYALAKPKMDAAGIGAAPPEKFPSEKLVESAIVSELARPGAILENIVAAP